MAKDAKGHGSEARGANTVDTVYSSKGVGGLGKGMYARLHSGQQLKLNPAATDGRIPRVGSSLDPSQHTAVPVGGGQPVASNAHAAAARSRLRFLCTAARRGGIRDWIRRSISMRCHQRTRVIIPVAGQCTT